MSSDAGATWIDRSPPAGVVKNMTAVTYGGNQFVAAGVDGALFTSPDAVTWAPRASGSAQTLRGLGYGNGVHVAVGDNGALLVSTNAAIDWTNRAPAGTGTLNGAAYGGGTFVVVGANGAVLTSPDGSNWTARSIGRADTMVRVIYANGLFITQTDSGRVFTSTDGAVWTQAARPSAGLLPGIGFGNETVVLVGAATILQSDPLPVLRTLTVTRTGSGSGTVTASGCTLTAIGGSARCSAVSGTNITLTATADSGSVFAGWTAATGSANCTGTASCTFNLAQDSGVTARFDLAAGAGGGDGDCFIATAAFGSPAAGGVTVLRAFRDEVLRKSAAGRAFTAWYYRTSPAISRWIVENPRSQAAVRVALYPAIGVAWLWLRAPWVLLLGSAALVLLVVRACCRARARRASAAA